MKDEQEEALRRKVRSQVDWIIHDAPTYFWVKNSRYWGLVRTVFGGGNLTMANNIFPALNYLSKVNFILRTDSKEFDKFTPFVTKEGAKKSKDFYIELDGGQKNLVSVKKEWQVNETLAFSSLVKDLRKVNINLGIERREAQHVWKSFRNYLTHMNYPKGFVSAGNYKVEEEIIVKQGWEGVNEELSKVNNLSFFRMTNALGDFKYLLDVELFILRDLPKILDHLDSKIVNARDENLKALKVWSLGASFEDVLVSSHLKEAI